MKLQVQYEIPDEYDYMFLDDLFPNGDFNGIVETISEYGRIYGPVCWQSKEGHGRID